MIKTRIIPTLLLKNQGLVKGVGFNSWRRVGSLLPAIKVYNSRDVDELILLDITATKEKLPPDLESVFDISSEVSVPFTVGGGISNIEQISALLNAGADKISINSSAYKNPHIIDKAAGKFGSQCIVSSVDVKKISESSYRCFSDSGNFDTGKSVEEWCLELQDRGAGEILLTSIDKDGSMEGYDIYLIQLVTSKVSIPVIASGGAGNYHHCSQAILEGNASAIAAASMFHFTDCTPSGLKDFLFSKGIPVRKNYKSN